MDLKQIFSEDELGALGVSVKLSGGLTISQAQKTALVAAIKQAQKAPAAQQLTILAKAKPAGWTAAKFKQVLVALKKELAGPAPVNVKGFGSVSASIRASTLAAIAKVKQLKGKPAQQLQVLAKAKPAGWTTAKFKQLVLALAPDIERWTAPPPPKKPAPAPKKATAVAPASTTIQIAGFGPVSRVIRNQSLSAIAAVNKLKGKPAQQLQVLAKAKPAGWTTAKFKQLLKALAPNIEQVLQPTPAKAAPKAPTTQMSPFKVAASVRTLVQKAAAPLVAAQRAPAAAVSPGVATIPLREVQKMLPTTPLKAVQAKTAVIIPPRGAQVVRPGALPVTARCPRAYGKLAAHAGLAGPSAMKLLAEIRDMVRTVSTRQLATSEHDAINNTNDFRRAVLCGLRGQLRSCS